MKKITALLLSAALLFALCACGAKSAPDPAPGGDTESTLTAAPAADFEKSTGDIAVAAALTLRNFTTADVLKRPAVIQDVLGWYCARLSLNSTVDYLTAAQSASIQHVLLPSSAPLELSRFTSEGFLEENDVDGEVVFRFPAYCDAYSGMFGDYDIDTVFDADKGEVTVSLTDTLFDTGTETFVFTFEADDSADPVSPYVLKNIVFPDYEQNHAGEAGITVEQLMYANGTRQLLDKYISVHCSYKVNDEYGYKSDTWYYKWNGHYISGEHDMFAAGGDEYYFNYDCYSVHRDEDRYKTYTYISGGAGGQDESYYDGIDRYINPGEIYDLNEKGDIISFYIKSVFDTESEPVTSYYEVKKDDLALLKFDSLNADGSVYSSAVFEYDAEPETYGFTDGWDPDDERVTTVNVSIYNTAGGDYKDEFMIALPYNIEVEIYSYYDVDIYMNKDLNKPYKYPGNGIDYTIYVTNAKG